MKILRYSRLALVVYVVLALALDSAIAFFQPRSGPTIVLRTYDAEGKAHERVLTRIEVDGQLWAMSGHWFRGWYHRVRENPQVEVIDGGVAWPYRAVALDPPESDRALERLGGGPRGAGYWASRAMFLFAPLKPVRLDPLAPPPKLDQ